jgi:hypothetical protein
MVSFTVFYQQILATDHNFYETNFQFRLVTKISKESSNMH